MAKKEIDPKTQCYMCGALLDICTAEKMLSGEIPHPVLCPKDFKAVRRAILDGQRRQLAAKRSSR